MTVDKSSQMWYNIYSKGKELSHMAETKVTRASVEKANKAEGIKVLEQLLNEQYGACYPDKGGFLVPVGKSPLDGAIMWVEFPYPVAKTVQAHKWGKDTKPYFNGYDVAKEWQKTLEVKAKKDAEDKRLKAEKAERDKAARAKKKAEKGE
jgi:hypothetical protein